MTVPPAGIVTEPLIAVRLAVKVLVVAPALTAVTTLVTVPSPLGKVSMKLEPVAVLGPELLITKVKFTVPPAASVPELAVLTKVRLDCGVTETTVVPVPEVPVEPGGRLTVAVFVMLPFAVALA